MTHDVADEHARDQRDRELRDPDHHRASVSDPEGVTVDPQKVRANLALAIERLDLDIDTAISFEDDVIALEELAVLIQMGMAGLLIADVVNTAAGVMLARYPEDLVRLPLPVEYDARRIYPLQFDDDEHERARQIVNLRGRLTRDLDPREDLVELLDGLALAGHIQVFMAVFAMCGSRLSALKSRTGIE